MKVLLVNKFHYKKGGSETYYFTLAEALKAKGHEVIYFAMRDEEKNLPCEQDKYFVSHAAVQGGLKSKLNMVLHIAYSKEAYQNMKRLLQDEQPDLVILNLVHKQITLSIIDAIKEYDPKLPIFWTMHDLITVCPSYLMLDGKGQICEKCLSGNYIECIKNRCVKGSRLMSVLSAYEAAYIRRREWYNKVDLFICPSDFHRGKMEAGQFTTAEFITLRNTLPLDMEYESQVFDEGYLLYFGRLSVEKGVKTLINAVNKTDYRLVILGTGPLEAELKEYAKDNSNIEFKGFQTGETLKNYIRNARCVVLPSACYENGPYSAMEAMAFGKPLIVSNNGGLPELVEHEKNGYIFDYNDNASKELRRSIEKMMQLSDIEYRNMALYSKEKAEKTFSPLNYINKIEDLYKKHKNLQEDKK